MNITEVIPDSVLHGILEAHGPCPKCGEIKIFINTPQSYACTNCHDWGNAAQYAIEREGMSPTEAVEAISIRSNYPLPEGWEDE